MDHLYFYAVALGSNSLNGGVEERPSLGIVSSNICVLIQKLMWMKIQIRVHVSQTLIVNVPCILFSLVTIPFTYHGEERVHYISCTVSMFNIGVCTIRSICIYQT